MTWQQGDTERRVGEFDRRPAALAPIESRIAVLEHRVAQIDIRLGPVANDVRQIRDTINGQRGFVAGFTAAFTLLWATVAALVWQIWRQIT